MAGLLGKLVGAAATAAATAAAKAAGGKTGGSGSQSASRPSGTKTTSTAAGTAGSASSTAGSGGKTVTYQKYTGGNAELDSALKVQSDRYYAAREAGDAAGMRDANDRANQIRNQYGYAAEFANEDIAKIAGQSRPGGSGGGGGSPSVPDTPVLQGPTDLSGYLEQMYQAQREAALAQINSAYQQNLSAIDRAQAGVDERYQTARNQTAGASELSARNFNEYAAAAGLGAGTGAQAELARNVALQNNLNSIDTAEADTYADLELQRANAEAEYNSAIAQAQANGDAALAQALYQEKVRVQQGLIDQQIQQYQMDLQRYQLQYQADRDTVSDQQWQQQFDTANSQWQQQFDYNAGRDTIADQQWQQQFDYNAGRDTIADQQWQQQFDYNVSQTERSQLAEYGNAFLQQGLMPSQEMLAAMGISSQDAQSYINLLKQQQAAAAGSSGTRSSGSSRSSGSRSSGSSKSSGSKGMSLTTAKQAAAAGNFEDTVISTLKANGYTDGMLKDIYGYDPYESDFKRATGSYRYEGTGTLFSTQEYNRFVNTVMGNRTKQGQLQTIKDAENEGKITQAQAQDLIQRFHLDS